MERQYKERETALKAEHTAALKAANDKFDGVLLNNAALTLANEISTTPDLVVDALKKRMKVNHDGETPIVEVVDDKGLATTLSVEDLGKEFVANTKYAAIMKGSNASGGSAQQQRGGASGTMYKGKKFADLSEAERVAFAKENPTGFETAKIEFQSKSSGL